MIHLGKKPKYSFSSKSDHKLKCWVSSPAFSRPYNWSFLWYSCNSQIIFQVVDNSPLWLSLALSLPHTYPFSKLLRHLFSVLSPRPGWSHFPPYAKGCLEVITGTLFYLLPKSCSQVPRFLAAEALCRFRPAFSWAQIGSFANTGTIWLKTYLWERSWLFSRSLSWFHLQGGFHHPRSRVPVKPMHAVSLQRRKRAACIDSACVFILTITVIFHVDMRYSVQSVEETGRLR